MSLTITSLVVLVLGRLLQWAGIGHASDEQLQHFVIVFMQIVGAIGIYVGRVRAGGITWYGKRIDSTLPLQ